MIYETLGGTRIVVRDEGPPGLGIPLGGQVGQVLLKTGPNDYDAGWSDPLTASGAVNGPIASSNDALAVWDGTTGNLLKNSTLTLSSVATVTMLATKVDKVDGFVLSQNSYTNADKAKLDALGTDNFRGNYATLAGLQTAIPAGNSGDYAYVLQPGQTAVQYIWDTVNNVWVEGTTTNFTGAQIEALYEAQPDTNKFSDYYKSLNDTAVQTTTFNATVLDFQNQINLLNPSSNPAAVRANLVLATTDAVAFASIQTAAVNGAAPAMQWGQITPITASGMTALGFTHQQAVSMGGTTYYTPLKSTAWA